MELKSGKRIASVKVTRRKTHAGSPDASSLSGLEIRHLRTFVALVEAGRVTAAARSLGVAQSTVSEALLALERIVGTPVILRRRGGHGLMLTAAGHALLPHARKILSAVDAAHRAFVSTSAGARTTVKIVANESVSSYLLPHVLQQLRRRWAGTRFTVSVATCADVRGGIASGAFDVGLLLEEQSKKRTPGGKDRPSPSFADRRTIISGIPLVLFSGVSHPLARDRASRPLHPDALSPFPLFISDAAGDFHDLVLRLFRNTRGLGAAIEAVGSVEGVKKAVIDDSTALGLLPAYAIVEEITSGTLAHIQIQPPAPCMRLDALLSQSRARHPSVDELLLAMESNGVIQHRRDRPAGRTTTR
jgi:molybdate transport repressor ModE-like protein